jgi:dTDP-glucose pyrophosphorylase
MINIVVPIAGHGSRFMQSGYRCPKPLIPVLGQSMIELVVRNMKPSRPHRFIFVCQSLHLRNFPLRGLLKSCSPECEIVEIDCVTEGPASTVLHAKDLFNNADPLVIADCGQYVTLNVDEYLKALCDTMTDGLIVTMQTHKRKWTHLDLDTANKVARIIDQKGTSDQALAGIYGFSHGADFVHAAEQMITKDLRVENEFKVAYAYNEMIGADKTIGFYTIGKMGKEMFCFGTPDDLDVFLKVFQKKSKVVELSLAMRPRICVLSTGLDRFHKSCSDKFKKQIGVHQHPIDFYGMFWQPVDEEKLNNYLKGFNRTIVLSAPQREFPDIPNVLKPPETNVKAFLSMAWGRRLLGHHMTENNLWDQYDLFIYCRPDVCFDHEIDYQQLLHYFESYDLCVPTNGHWRGGVNDQACFSGKMMPIYLNFFADIEKYMKQLIMFHPETLLKHHLVDHGVRIAQYPIRSIIYRDEMNWQPG